MSLLLLRCLATPFRDHETPKGAFPRRDTRRRRFSTMVRSDPRGMLVLDDLMEEAGHDKHVLDLFTKESHHRGITVLYLCQDLFPPGRFAKTISRNAHYIIAFKNPRDQTGLRTLLLQAFPDRWKSILKLFNECTQHPYGYIMIDMHPASDDRFCLFSNVTVRDGPTVAYEHL